MRTLALCALLLMSGCASPSLPALTQEQRIVRTAEQTINAAFDAVDSFLLWEYHNRESLGATTLDVADLLRREAPNRFLVARSMLRAYKERPSPQQAQGVEDAVAAVMALKSKAEGAKR
jgi:hypothetical protein